MTAFQDIIFRRLHGSDAPAFRAIRLEALRDHPDAFGASWEDEQVHPESRFVERLENGHVIGAISEDNSLVGTIGVSRSDGQKTRHIGSIWGLYVQPSARGKGLARSLLEAAIDDVRPSLKSLRLCVEANNASAIRLYESFGFVQWALEAEALRIGDVFHDEIHMRLDLL